jgi:aspartyl-tRNA(Asn)/glutamyl-tRNA(Gln) amidotransferase subunit C
MNVDDKDASTQAEFISINFTPSNTPSVEQINIEQISSEHKSDSPTTNSATQSASFDKFEIKKIAKLANLTLSVYEEDLYRLQLGRIINYLEALKEVDTSEVEPTFNVSGRENILREDISEAGLTQEEALSNAPSKREGFFVSKGVFSNE